jgi:UDP-N-acetylmuramoyl-tripeptide--D-alanyl-D-alanine ligase
VVDDPIYATSNKHLLVPDVLTALQELARYHRLQLGIPILAITGSNGKTTTKELVHTVLQQRYQTLATEGNLNNHIGVPLTLLKMTAKTELAVVEMGANHQREIASYCRIALPNYGLITNVGKAHIEGFGGEEGVRKGKGELFDYLTANGGTILRNADLPYLTEMAGTSLKQVTYGTQNCDYVGTAVPNSVFLSVDVAAGQEIHRVNTQLVGSYNFANVMAAVAVGMHFDVPFAAIKQAIERYAPDNSRSQWLQLGSNRVIMDAYNANPSSMSVAISNIATSGLAKPMLWIGGMKEMGAAECEEHAAITHQIDQYQWADVVLVGPEFEKVAGRYTWFPDSSAAAEYVRNNQPNDATILIKGSRGSKMENLLAALKAIAE